MGGGASQGRRRLAASDPRSVPHGCGARQGSSTTVRSLSAPMCEHAFRERLQASA